MVEALLALLVTVVLHPWSYAVPILSIIGYNWYRLIEDLEEATEESGQ